MPLTGVRVLDLSRLLPGPYCTLILAELGADVIKVEDTLSGDYLRHLPPQRGGLNGAFYALNRGKRSVSLDLKTEEGKGLLLALVRDTEVIVESFRPGVLDRLGIGYPVLCQQREDLILCSISGYGQTGPLAQRAGHDINYQALAGLLALTGDPDARPPTPGVQIADIAGGALWATIRILAALRRGGGEHIDVSMTEGALSFLLPWLGEYAFSGTAQRRAANLLNGANACYRTYRAQQGDLALGALEPKFWQRICAALEQEPGGVQQLDSAAQPPIAERLERNFAEKTRDEWADQLAPIDGCCEPILEMDELQSHPQHQARQMFFEFADPARSNPMLLRLPLGPPRATTPAPSLGEHTDSLLKQLGKSDDELKQLRQRGIIK